MNFCRTLSALLVFGLVSLNQSDVHHHSADGKHDNAFDHEAILGSAKEAAEFDTLPAEDAKSRLKLLVGKISHMEGFL
jgi:hypothetical protein